MHALKFLLYQFRMKISLPKQPKRILYFIDDIFTTKQSRLTPLRIDIFVLTHLRVRNEISPKMIIGGTHLLVHKFTGENMLQYLEELPKFIRTNFMIYVVQTQNASFARIYSERQEGGKGLTYFVTRDRLFLFPMKCEITIFFLVNRDFHSGCET